MSYVDYLYPITNLKLTKFFGLILSIQLSIIGLITFQTIGFNIPILRQIIGFIYLTFIPGVLILRILRLEKLSIIETFIYSAGLSIATLMFMGLIMNFVFPFFGISNPISLFPLICTIIVLILTLSLFSYLMERKRGKIRYNTNFINLRTFLSKKIIILSLIPFLSILGAYLVNFYDNHFLMFILIIIISIIPLYVMFSKEVKEEVYPFIIFVCGISLLFHWSLISMNLTGGDIQYEYYFSNLVSTYGYWNPQIPNNLNAMLSVVMLPPIYSKILNLNIVWIFKIIYPLIFVLVPLSMYHLFKKQTTDGKIGFLSVFYFMFVFPFFSELLQLARQEIAELFFVLLLILLTNHEQNRANRSILLIIFGFALIVSHYGLSYIFIIILILSWVFSVLSTRMFFNKIMKVVYYIGYKLKVVDYNGYKFNQGLDSSLKNRLVISKLINLKSSFVLLVFILAFLWYTYVSNESAFTSIVSIGSNMVGSIENDFLSTTNLQAVSMITYDYGMFHAVTKYLYLFSEGLILLGVISFLLNPRIMRFNRDYKFLTMSFVVILLFSLVIPNFASSLDTTRLYHIILFILAPFAVIGILISLNIVNKIFRLKKLKFNNEKSFKLFAAFLMIFLLFTSGLVYAVTNDQPVSIALSNIDFPQYSVQEVYGAHWVSYFSPSNSSSHIAADTYGVYLINEFLPVNRTFMLGTEYSLPYNYLFLREINIRMGNITAVTRNGEIAETNYISLNNYTNGRNELYSNGGTIIYGN
jgi:uncharacterized membrane protein